jgi:hypothetical protein
MRSEPSPDFLTVELGRILNAAEPQQRAERQSQRCAGSDRRIGPKNERGSFSQIAVTHSLAMELMGRTKRATLTGNLNRRGAWPSNCCERSFCKWRCWQPCAAAASRLSKSSTSTSIRAGKPSSGTSPTAQGRGVGGARKMHTEPIPLAIHLAPRCGARTRIGTLCRQPATAKGALPNARRCEG